MSAFYAYTRVSTQKQGVKGVSLEEQRAAIERYAARHGLRVVQWFEERLTAAKSGRPLFATMLKGLRRGDAQGIIIHKIDRGARNLRDWADLGELIDSGVSVHFANESLDLQSRGGRLSADIQAVVAADFIRNVREEALKGLRGRISQGLYPFNAPLGYTDAGGGKPKEVDPLRGPLVRQAFELYASGQYSLDSLLVRLRGLGLTTRRGGTLSRSALSKILNNQFYAGLVKLRSSGETFAGKHLPLVTMELFKAVRARLSGKHHVYQWTHDYLFRGLFRCRECGRSLTGERQKGRIYYRCHTRGCPTKTLREDLLEKALFDSFGVIAQTPEDAALLMRHLDWVKHTAGIGDARRRSELAAQLGALKSREVKLVDAFLDGLIDKITFDQRKQKLLEDRRVIEDALRPEKVESGDLDARTALLFELACTAQQSYILADRPARREIVLILTSNRLVGRNNVSVEPSFPIATLKNRPGVSCGAHQQDTVRTAQALWAWAKAEIKKRDAEEPL